MLYGYLAGRDDRVSPHGGPELDGAPAAPGRAAARLVLAGSPGGSPSRSRPSPAGAAAAAIDLAFPSLVLLAAAREIVSGRNWRNLKILDGPASVRGRKRDLPRRGPSRAARPPRAAARASRRRSASIMLVGGRIVPSFTRNWLARENPGRLPAPLGRFDVLSLAVGGAAARRLGNRARGLANGRRPGRRRDRAGGAAARWAGDRTWRDPLVLILHVALRLRSDRLLLVGAAALAPVGCRQAPASTPGPPAPSG